MLSQEQISVSIALQVGEGSLQGQREALRLWRAGRQPRPLVYPKLWDRGLDMQERGRQQYTDSYSVIAFLYLTALGTLCVRTANLHRGKLALRQVKVSAPVLGR